MGLASLAPLFIGFLGLAACGHASPPPQAQAPATLRATHAAHAPVVDGELDEPGWLATARTPRFVDAVTGQSTPPHTEARALWDRDALYLGLYAGDLDLEPSDRMGAVLRTPAGRTWIVDVDPASHLHWHPPGAPDAPIPAGVSVGIDVDGTYATPGDDDEEWVAELRVPWRALGLAAPADLRVNFFRRDQPPGSPPRQLAWIAWRTHATSDVAVLGLLTLAGNRVGSSL